MSVPQDRVAQTRDELYAEFQRGTTRPLAWRKTQLRGLLRMLDECRDTLVAAVSADLGKRTPFEASMTEYSVTRNEIAETLERVDAWATPRRVSSPIGMQPAASSVEKHPLGAVLVIAPWNYPVCLALVPLAGALAAGNTVFVKFSRHSAHTARTLVALLPRFVCTRAVAVDGDGGAPYITTLLEQRWDHVFFTGSVSVGRVVALAAARHLTPCTLELGGKNPTIVDATVDPALAARRIIWAKTFNAGQTCIGVDYVLVTRDAAPALLVALKAAITQFYGDEPEHSESLARIISVHHARRLERLFSMGTVECGGRADVERRYVAPTIISAPRLDSELMSDEIFGPVLPFVVVDSIDDAIEFVRPRPLPLALYLFTRDDVTIERVKHATRSGAFLVNDCIVHFANSRLPFGGVGASGMGRYHGRRTFDTFSHSRAVVHSTARPWLDLPVRYPPYTPTKQLVTDLVLKARL